MSSWGRVRRAAVPAALMALLAACGSTVQNTAGGVLPPASRPGVVDDGLGSTSVPGAELPGTAEVPAAPDGALPGLAPDASGPLVPGTPSGPGVGTQGGAVSPGSPAGPAAKPVGGKPSSSAQGVTDTTILTGLEYSTGVDEAQKAAGTNITAGDQRRQQEVMIAEINRLGGLAGRQIKPVFHVYDAASAEPTASQEQAACATFTQDNKVFAVLAAAIHSASYLACLAKANVPYIAAPSFTVTDEVDLARFPLYVELNTVSLSRQGRMYGEPLAKTGYYSAGAKVELLTFSRPSYQRAVKDHLEPALRRVGQQLVEKVELPFPESASENGSFAAAVSNAVLRFRDKGVTHLLITDVNGSVTQLFANQASNQGYYPRYGWLSQNGGQAISDTIPDKRAMHGAVQLGWIPTLDLNAANETITAPGSKACLEFFGSKGLSPASRNEDTVFQIQCDVFFHAQAAGARVSDLSAQSFVRAYAAIGDAVRPASTYSISLKDQRSGAESYRSQAWDVACTCFKTTSNLLALP